MNLKLKNFGKIVEADIQLNGITVICGNNNTGKSTIGKALFSFYNSLYDYKSKIRQQKAAYLTRFIVSNHDSSFDISDIVLDDSKITSFIGSREHNYTEDEIKDFLEQNLHMRFSKEKISSLSQYLNLPDFEILNEYVFRYFNIVMNNQLKNLYSAGSSKCYLSAKIKDYTDTISFYKRYSSCDLTEPIEHRAYYINSPFALDLLNQSALSWRLNTMNPMDRSVIEAITKAQEESNTDSMNNILDSVINKKELDEVRSILKHAYNGDTIISQGKYFYSENGVECDIRNISAGLKSFAIIERMLETGVLKKKDVLILDEPEIHLHSEWQLLYAELIVVLQKVFDLNILLVTHSVQFLESLIFFMDKYNTSNCGNYYTPREVEKGFVIESSENTLLEIRKCLKSGMFKLSDLKLAALDNGDSDEDN